VTGQTVTRGGDGIGARATNLVSVAGATGGIVTRPTVALIGEAGPEAVIPLNKTPGSSPLPTGASSDGARIINLTVNAGMGADGARIGNMIIETIKQYERHNGAGWRS
jgi:SLT domain-containing protein